MNILTNPLDFSAANRVAGEKDQHETFANVVLVDERGGFVSDQNRPSKSV